MHGRARGFTLIELLVSLAIFGLVSMMAYGGLHLLVNNRDQIDRSADRLAEIQRGLGIIERELQQAVARGIRDPLGDPRPAMLSDDLAIIEFTSGGRSNPLGLERSEFRRVGYTVADDELVRMSWDVLDQAHEPPVSEHVLLTGVETLELRYLGADDQWLEVWPPAAAPDVATPLPRAVELIIELQDHGTLRRLVLLPDAARAARAEALP